MRFRSKWPLVTDQPTYHLSPPSLHAPVLVWSLIAGPVAGVAGLAFLRLMTLARVHAPTGWRSVGAVIVVFTALGFSAIAYPQLLGNGKGPAQESLDDPTMREPARRLAP